MHKVTFNVMVCVYVRQVLFGHILVIHSLVFNKTKISACQVTKKLFLGGKLIDHYKTLTPRPLHKIYRIFIAHFVLCLCDHNAE